MAINYQKYIDSKSIHYIANSGSDERGGSHGGQPGDQTGGEWILRSWYNRPWTVVLRHPNPAVGQQIAKLAIAAALNNHIGYNQWNRKSYWTQLQKVNYDPSKITVNCDEDCTAGVTANTKAAGHLLGIKKLQDISIDTYSGNMRVNFVAAGFCALTAKMYLTSYNYLLPGDILLYEGHHAATNITCGKYATPLKPSPEPTPTPVLSPTGTIPIRHGNYYIHTEPRKDAPQCTTVKTDETVVYFGVSHDGWNKVQKNQYVGWLSSKAGDPVDGTFLTIKESTWNIREKPVTGKIVKSVSGGMKVMYLGDDGDKGWKHVYYDGTFGYISPKAIKN